MNSLLARVVYSLDILCKHLTIFKTVQVFVKPYRTVKSVYHWNSCLNTLITIILPAEPGAYFDVHVVQS
jgi:hypothetical protein